ncbi:MAG: hypothetical protein RLP15_12515 [Cryomorphaceae bacterium]
MLRIVPLLALLVIAASATAQKEEGADAPISYEIQFKNKTKTFTLIYDDPLHQPKFQVQARFFNPSVDVRNDEVVMGFTLTPIYHLNPKLWISADIFSPYTGDLDGTLSHNPEDVKLYRTLLDVHPVFHLTLLTDRRETVKKVSVDYEYSEDVTYVYNAELPRVSSRTLDFDFGLNYHRQSNLLRFGAQDSTQFPGSTQTHPYQGGTMNALSAVAGVSVEFLESVKYRTDGNEYAYWNQAKVFAQLTYALASFYPVYLIEDENRDDVYERVKTDYEQPEFIRVGYRIGAQKTLGFKNTGAGMFGGATIVGYPFMRFEGREAGNLFFEFYFGFTLGKRP